jgi:uncharacterized protein
MSQILPPLPTLAQRLADREMPAGLVVGYQRWRGLLFLHWALGPETIQALLPEGLWVDQYEGSAYVGIVPFFMDRIRPRGLPPVPGISWFLELNVRTYVYDASGRPGVYFFSLDCNQPLAVWLARAGFQLPYFHAAMTAHMGSDGWLDYTCHRTPQRAWASVPYDEPPVTYRWRLEPQDPADSHAAEPGSLEFFLVERYTLFTARPDGRIASGRVRHAPYQIYPASVQAWSPRPAEMAGMVLEGPPCSILGAAAVDVRIHPLR